MNDGGSDSSLRQSITDEVHLDLLKLGYWVFAGVSAFAALMGVLYASFGVFVATIIAQVPPTAGQQPPPEFFRWIFFAVGAAMSFIFTVDTVLNVIAARCLKARRSRAFCMVVAGLSCLCIPFGTILGVATFIVLGRPSVAALFRHETSSASPGTPTAP